MMQSVDQNIPDLRSISFLNPQVNSINVIYAGIALNFSLFICLIIDGILFTYQQKLNNFLKSFHRKMQLYISFIAQIYNYVIFIPLVYHTLLQYDLYYISCISFISCILISTAISLHNQSYGFSNQHTLGFRTPFVWQFCLRFLEVINCIFLSFVNELTGLIIVNFILAIYQLIYLSFGCFLNRIKTLFWMVFFNCLYLFLAITLFIGDVNNQQISMILLALIVIPISYSITQIISKKDLDFEVLKQNKDKYNPKKDFLIRQLLLLSKLDYEDYRTSSLSQFHEIISLDHIINCTQYPKCFCFDTINQLDQYKYEDFQQSVLSGRLRLKFLNQFIYELFKNFCSNKRLLKNSGYTIDAYLSFINYLIDIKKSKVQVFCELVKLNSKQNISLRERALLQETYKKAQKNFDNQTIAQTQIHAKKVDKEQQIQQNVVYEKTRGSSKKSFVSVELRDYLCGIKFDEGLNSLQQLYEKCLAQKENILKMLSNDFINLKDFKQKAIEYYNNRLLLQNTLKNLSRIHYNSQKLQFFMDRYVQIMAFGQRKKDIFKNYKKNKQNFNEFNSESSNIILKMFNKVDQKIFDKDNCVIFITLIDDIGTIKRSQSKFEPMFGYSLKEALGKNISIILPNQIAPFHNAILQDFVDEQLQYDESSNNLRNKYSNTKSLLLAKNQDGWAVPISIVFKTDNIGLEDCGLTTHIIKLKSDSAFIMTSVQQFQIQLISEILFDRLFNRFINNQSDLRRIYLNKIIPLLHYFEKKWVKIQETTDSDIHKDFVKTIAFLPKYDQKINSFKTNSLSTTNTFGLANTRKKRSFIFEAMEYSQLDNEIKNYSVESMDVFSVQIKFTHTTNKYFSYNVIEIASFRKLLDTQEIKECLQTFSGMMKSLLDISYPLQREYAKLDMLNQSQIQLQSSYSREQSANHTLQMQRVKKPYQQLEEILDRSELKQEEEIQSQQNIKNVNNNEQGNENNNEQNDDKTPKDQSIYLDLKKLKLEVRDLSNQHIQSSSRMDLDYQHNQSFINSSSNFFDQSQFIDQQNRTSKNHQILQLQNMDNKNSSYTKIPNIQETNINHIDANQYVQTLQSLNKIAVKEFEKAEEFNHFSAKDSTYYNTELQTNAQNINTTDRIYDTQGQGQDQGKLEKLLFEHKSSFQEISVNKQKSQNQIQNSKNMTTSLQMKMSEKKNQQDNLMMHAKQIGVSKNQQDNNQKLNKRFSEQTFKKTGTIYSKNQEYNFGQNSSFEKKNSKAQQDLDIYQNKWIYENEFEGEDILKKRQNNNGNGSYSSSDDYYYKYEKKKSNLVATSSIHTSKSHNYEQKRNLKASITSKRKNFLMIALTLFGLCSVSVVVALTLFQYFNILNQFSLAQTCFQFLPWPMSIRGSYVITMQQESIISLINHNTFQGIQDNNYLQTSIQTLNDATKSLVQLFYQYQSSDQTRMTFFNYLNENQLHLVTSIDDRLSKNPETYNPAEKDIRNVTVAYFIQAICGYFNQISHQIQNTLYYQKIQTDNFIDFNNHLVKLQSQIQDDATSIINSIQQQVLILLILVIVLAIILIGAIFPIYYFVQIQNELILKLFATIQPEHLKAMMIPIQLAQSEEKSSKFKILPENFKKKKTISSTSVLPKFKPIFVVYCLISFAILIIQPITNYILNHAFQQETFLNIDLLLNLYDLKANFISSVAVFFSVIGDQMELGIQLYNINYYQTRMGQLINTNQQKLDQMYSTMSSSYAQSRYQQSYYDNFLYKIIQDNMCQAYQNYPQFISQEDQIDQKVCNSIYNGSLQKGFEFSVKLFLSSFVDLHQIIEDKPNFKKNMIQWESENKIQEFNKFFNILYNSINIMRDFMLQMMKDQLEMMKEIQTILLLFQLFALFFVFLVGWVKFYNYVTEEMYLVKNLISIISIEVVLENPYIMSYLNQ
ncbi:transmembrane protein, putative (macronuclear) [Tetrahymena thermophila SB210]|uniref:Transmembrane protein, putative n=1 Tax=Tetrahymena thermophila (strain SB210) TaxID=312017 RepID=Q23R44_TETTS|nr:transmembrane protein, putative [Tetrahymena thermophila SB210]EAR98997.2 transmembrane protein, putative [Tetrahymena thermophila SB210]|eukprot:XP_001019242.2 transmembrane protein, putative [Tetrahymena thermophila SB210]